MYDMKTLYFNNIVETYMNHGYSSMNSYDKYHIMLMVISILTLDYRINLGEFVRSINLPKNILNKFPILGLNNNRGYIVPSLYDISMCIIKRDRLYSDNNYYNKRIIRAEEISRVSDRSNYINEYIMKIYNTNEKFIIEHLIDQYTRKNFTINTFYNLNVAFNHSDEEEIEWTSDEENNEEINYHHEDEELNEE